MQRAREISEPSGRLLALLRRRHDLQLEVVIRLRALSLLLLRIDLGSTNGARSLHVIDIEGGGQALGAEQMT